MVVVITVIGRILYGAPIPWERLPAIAVTLVIGAASFCCLGIALTAIIPSRDAAPAITNVITLPLYFLSGIFIPENEIPGRSPDLRRPFPDPTFLRGFLHGLQPVDQRCRVRVVRPAGGSRLGGAGTAAGGPVLPLDPARVNSAGFQYGWPDAPPRDPRSHRTRTLGRVLRRADFAARLAAPRRRSRSGRLRHLEADSVHHRARRSATGSHAWSAWLRPASPR